jgi:Tn3 transposase DDE domain
MSGSVISEQNIWNEYSELVANAIIFYNTYFLSKQLERLPERSMEIDLLLTRPKESLAQSVD